MNIQHMTTKQFIKKYPLLAKRNKVKEDDIIFATNNKIKILRHVSISF